MPYSGCSAVHGVYPYKKRQNIIGVNIDDIFACMTIQTYHIIALQKRHGMWKNEKNVGGVLK